MESNDELRDFDIKNLASYYFKDFGFNNFLLDKKSYKNILIYDILCKTLIGTKPLRNRFNKVNGFIRVYDGNRYLV